MHNKNSSLCMQNLHVSLKTPPLPPTKQLCTIVYSKKIFFNARTPKNSWGKRKSFCQMPCLVKTLACIFILFTNLKTGIILHNFFQARIILQLSYHLNESLKNYWCFLLHLLVKYIEATEEAWLGKYALWIDIQTCY